MIVFTLVRGIQGELLVAPKCNCGLEDLLQIDPTAEQLDHDLDCPCYEA